jgi:HSP20 family molecular chaperone IbpA
MEITYGTFERVIEMPDDCDLTLGKALYQNGFLRVEVPYATKSSTPHTISVTDD